MHRHPDTNSHPLPKPLQRTNPAPKPSDWSRPTPYRAYAPDKYPASPKKTRPQHPYPAPAPAPDTTAGTNSHRCEDLLPARVCHSPSARPQSPNYCCQSPYRIPPHPPVHQTEQWFLLKLLWSKTNRTNPEANGVWPPHSPQPHSAAPLASTTAISISQSNPPLSTARDRNPTNRTQHNADHPSLPSTH